MAKEESSTFHNNNFKFELILKWNFKNFSLKEKL
jgi:hypothetical protein